LVGLLVCWGLGVYGFLVVGEIAIFICGLCVSIIWSKMSKVSELAKFLDCEVEDLEESSYDESLFSWGNEEYLVYTDEEADEAVKDYIKESAWSFQAWFIVDHSELPYEAIEMVQGFQKKCEGANETILALITDLDEFVNDAISADGRGHFLSGYDGKENEIENYFVFRTN